MAAGAKIVVKVLTLTIAIPVGIATRKLVEEIWSQVHPEQPPRKPSEQGVQWADAITWAALSATGIVVADLISRRGAEAAFKAITGNEPPPAKPAKTSKKPAKASARATARAGAGAQAATA
jgi:hypothetical protein